MMLSCKLCRGSVHTDEATSTAHHRCLAALKRELEDARHRIAYLEGAVVGLASTEDAEKILAGGPGKREIGVILTT